MDVISLDRNDGWKDRGGGATDRTKCHSSGSHSHREAFFGTNDFFPFTREELEKHDPEMVKLLQRVWNRAR